MNEPADTQKTIIRPSETGFTLAELLISLGLMALLAVLTIPSVMRVANDTSQRTRIAEDMVQHLEAVCNTVKLQYGSGPLTARKVATYTMTSSAYPFTQHHNFDYAFTDTPSTEDPDGWQYVGGTNTTNTYADLPANGGPTGGLGQCAEYSTSYSANALPNTTYVCNTLYRGIGVYLATWETMAKRTVGPPDILTYPDSRVLYLRPNQASVPDPGSEINKTGGTHRAGGSTFPYDYIMPHTDDRQWLLLDMDGASGANSLGPTGDRILLYVDDKSCKVLTARQKCNEVNSHYSGSCVTGATPALGFAQSFYDVARCNALGANCSHAGFN